MEVDNYQFQRVVIACWVFVVVFTLNTLENSFVEGKRSIPERYRGLKHKGTVKTIVDPEDDIVIDCVNFYEQPAFDNPRIQVDPSLFPGEKRITDEDLKKSGLYQNWRKYGKCPTGTIPIRRIQNRNKHRKRRIDSNGISDPLHEYAIIRHPYGKYYGGRADLNVWEPKTEPQEFSLTQIWITSGENPPRGKINTIEAGWTVFTERYQDSRPTTFIYWTADEYEKTGCYDLDCPGFLQLYMEHAIGVPLKSSIYNNTSAQEDLSVEMYHLQNGPYKQWFLYLNGIKIGYWPNGTFTSLTDGADTVHWGGEIINMKPQGHHTTTQMGSGHFSGEDYDKASYVKKMAIMNSDKEWVNVENFERSESRPDCYNVGDVKFLPGMGSHFYYGGPGYSEHCQ